MTAKELYEFCKSHNAENFEIAVQYRDGGGFYTGEDYIEVSDVEILEFAKEVLL